METNENISGCITMDTTNRTKWTVFLILEIDNQKGKKKLK